jgi:hypothetical protein
MSRNPGNRPPAPGFSVNEVDVSKLTYEDLPPTGRALVESLPPKELAMAKWIASMERRIHQANHPSMPPIKKTRELVDLAKYFLSIVVGLVAFGFWASQYLDQFQTDTEAASTQGVTTRAIEGVRQNVEDNETAIDGVRLHTVRIELEQQNSNDRLEQLLSLEQAESRYARHAAKQYVTKIQQRINTREQVLRNPRALRRAATQIEEDPLNGLDGL